MTVINWLVLGAAALIGYLLGSIPFGLLVTRAGGAQDPRTLGSGNIGATNVLRTGRKELAVITLLLDAAKGAVAVLVAGHVWPDLTPPSVQAIVAGAFAFIGHIFPVWLRFRGGKGVATFLGIALALYWPAGLVFSAVWLGAFFLTRHSSVGGMAAAIATPVSVALLSRDRSDLTLTFLLLALIVLWNHRANVERLLDGTEPRFGSGA